MNEIVDLKNGKKPGDFREEYFNLPSKKTHTRGDSVLSKFRKIKSAYGGRKPSL